MPIEIIVIIVFFVLMAGTIFVGCRFLAVNKLNPTGKGAYKKTASTLKRFAVIRGYKVISNINFIHKGKQHYLENVLIGRFGILAVHTLGGRGEYYGQLESAEWRRQLNDKKELFPNPVIAQDEAVTALRAVLSQSKVYSVPIECLVVLTSLSNKTKMYITNDNRIFMPKKLGAYLGREKFENDAGVNIEEICAVIDSL